MPEYSENSVSLIGRLTRDPEIRSIERGDRVAHLLGRDDRHMEGPSRRAPAAQRLSPGRDLEPGADRGDRAPSQKGLSRARRRLPRASQLRGRPGGCGMSARSRVVEWDTRGDQPPSVQRRCLSCRRRRCPHDASHHILIGQLGNRDWYLLSGAPIELARCSAGCRPVPSNRARQKA